jgi:hypothetical protein
MTEDSFGFSEEPANGPLIPTVHAILMRKLDDHGHPELGLDGRPGEGDMQRYTKEAETIRGDLIRYITSAVRGDRLAAELVLLHFLARMYVVLMIHDRLGPCQCRSNSDGDLLLPTLVTRDRAELSWASSA